MVYEDEGYTGFLPVKLTIHPPNFVHQWGEEDYQGQITFKSLPIDSNGVYKFLYNGGELGPFALGYIPVKRYNSSTEDFDFAVNVPEVEKLVELEPGQVIPIKRNKRKKTFELFDKDADSDMDIEETDDQPLQQQQQRKLTLLEKGKTRDINDTSYRNIGEFEIDVNIPIYDGYDQSNPYTITQNGSGVISIPQNYEGLGEINYTVNVPQTLVNNYTQPTITSNGTYTIPNGYTGFNDFIVNVEQQRKGIKYLNFNIGNSTTVYTFTKVTTATNYIVYTNQEVVVIKKIDVNTNYECLELYYTYNDLGNWTYYAQPGDYVFMGNYNTNHARLCLWDQNKNLLLAVQDNTDYNDNYKYYLPTSIYYMED